MNNDLNKDQKIKLKKLFEKKDYSGFEQEVEKLGKIENLPDYLIMGYAGSKTLNPKSKKEDYLKSTILFEQIYSKNKSNLEALYNLIISSLKAETSIYVLKHLYERYEKNKHEQVPIRRCYRQVLRLRKVPLTVLSLGENEPFTGTEVWCDKNGSKAMKTLYENGKMIYPEEY